MNGWWPHCHRKLGKKKPVKRLSQILNPIFISFAIEQVFSFRDCCD